jgi:BirA family biotin operon repressor/biotin-[acetyl-CoA-carboxylase] ligase
MIGSTIVHLDIVDSTNNYAAKELLTKSLNEGTVFVAACQQSGRGQGASSWESSEGMNLTFTIVLYPRNLEVSRQFLISKTIALGIADFLSGQSEGIRIKWPNDIYAGDRKIAGILIETAVMAGKISRAVVGIGLNINQEIFFSDAPNPVSLKNQTGITYDLQQTLQELCFHLDRRYLQMIGFNSFQINQDFERLLYRLGEWAMFRTGGSEFEGMIMGTDAEGQLLIQDRNGKIRGFQFKEVQFLLPV